MGIPWHNIYWPPHPQSTYCLDLIGSFNQFLLHRAVSKEATQPTHFTIWVEISKKVHISPINYSEQVTSQTSGELQIHTLDIYQPAARGSLELCHSPWNLVHLVFCAWQHFCSQPPELRATSFPFLRLYLDSNSYICIITLEHSICSFLATQW